MEAQHGGESSWLTVDQIAAHLQVSKETIYRWLDRETIPAARIGRQWRFKAEQVDAWVLKGLATENHRPESVAQTKSKKAK